MTHRSTAVATFVLAIASLGLAGQATASPRLADGLYVIEAHHWLSDRAGGCLIVGNKGADKIPSLFHWGRNYNRDGQCGLSWRKQDVLNNRQAVWEVYTVHSPGLNSAYVIKSRVNGHCLVRQTVQPGRPTLHLWTGIPGGNARFCGFREARDLINNGQAAWGLYLVDSFGPASQFVNYVLSQSGRDFLTFSPTPRVFPNTIAGVQALYQYGNSAWTWHFVRMDL